MTESPWMTLDEAAAYLRVSERTMRTLVVREQVTAYRVSPRGALRFKAGDLDACLEPATGPAPPTALSDPVLAELWDNDDDAVYDDI